MFAALANVFFTLASIVIHVSMVGDYIIFATFSSLLTSIFAYAIAVLVNSTRDSEIRAIIDAKIARDFAKAANALLSLICDAVVQLTSSYDIAEASPKLEALLSRQSHHGLKGTNFVDLLHTDCPTEAFVDFMSGLDADSEMMSIVLKDSKGGKVRAQLFRASGPDFDDLPFHVVGIKRESTSSKCPQSRSVRI